MGNLKYRIGVMGCADIAQRMVIPNILNSDYFELIAVASRTLDKANVFANKFNCEAVIGYQNLLNRKDIDLIYMPLPTSLHFEWIKKALNAGKHIYVEKSFVCNYNEALELVNLAKEKNLLIFENFMFPFHSQFKFVKEQIAAGLIGDIRLLRSSFGFPIFNVNTNIRYKKELNGGALLDAGAYTLMAAQLFLGNKQNVVSAVLNNLGYEVDFQGSVVLQNENEIISQLSFGFDNYYQNNIELWGSKGKIIMERAFTAPPGFNPKIVIEHSGRKEEVIAAEDNHFANVLEFIYEILIKSNFSEIYTQILNQSLLIDKCLNFTH